MKDIKDIFKWASDNAEFQRIMKDVDEVNERVEKETDDAERDLTETVYQISPKGILLMVLLEEKGIAPVRAWEMADRMIELIEKKYGIMEL